MTSQEVIDIAYNTRTAVTGVRIDTAFLAIAANLAGVGRVNVFADYVSVIVKGVCSCDYVIGSLALVGILLFRSSYKSSS